MRDFEILDYMELYINDLTHYTIFGFRQHLYCNSQKSIV